MQTDDIDPFDKLIYFIVDEIQECKTSNGKAPVFASKEEIFNSVKVEVMEALRRLYSKQVIEHRKTLNGEDLFRIKQKLWLSKSDFQGLSSRSR